MRRAERLRRIQKHAKAHALKVVPPARKEGLAALCDLMEGKMSKLREERDEAVSLMREFEADLFKTTWKTSFVERVRCFLAKYE